MLTVRWVVPDRDRLIEPLYVAGGFALYLAAARSSRVDLEVQLRRSAQRTDQPDAAQPVALSPDAVLLVVSLAPAPPRLRRARPKRSAAPHSASHPSQTRRFREPTFRTPWFRKPRRRKSKRHSPGPQAAARRRKRSKRSSKASFQTPRCRLESSATKRSRQSLSRRPQRSCSFMQFIAEILRESPVLLAPRRHCGLGVAPTSVHAPSPRVDTAVHAVWPRRAAREPAWRRGSRRSACPFGRPGRGATCFYRGAGNACASRRVEFAGGDTRRYLATPTYSYLPACCSPGRLRLMPIASRHSGTWSSSLRSGPGFSARPGITGLSLSTGGKAASQFTQNYTIEQGEFGSV